MANVSNRLDRISDLLKRELALLIQNEIRDPRVGMASVTAVKVSRDLAYANVFITILNKSSTEEAKEAIDTLNKASGFLRTLLAKAVNLRVTPKLKFVFDDSVSRGQHLSALIDEALEQDSHFPDQDESDQQNN